MDNANEAYAELIQWLRQQGQSDEEINRVLDRIGQYEQDTQLDSIMDSIGSGNLDLDKFLEELGGNDEV